MSSLNDLFAFHLDANDIQFEREYQAIKGRKYLFDFRLGNLLIEIQGGIWMRRGAHNTGKAITRDCEKLNLATLAGYDVMHFTTDMVESGEAVNLVLRYLEEK